MNARAVVATAFLACAGLTACVTARTPSAPPATWSRLEEQRIPDTQIVDVLRREMWQDAAAGRERVRMRVAQGVVTLSGTVSTRLAQLRAIEIAHVVRGVRGVIDRIVVECPTRSEQELERAVASTLESDPITVDSGIAVHAVGDIALLSGDVDSNAVRRAAEEDTLGVVGVRDVADYLAVVPAARTDARLRAEVARSIRQDAWVDSSRLSVDVSEGVVRLSGQVDTEAERARAQNDARAATPPGIDIGGLRVVPPPADDGTLRGSPPQPRRDADIAEIVAEVYASDPRLRTSMPTFEVLDGVVYVGGYTATAQAARAAEDDARNVAGVNAVRPRGIATPRAGVTMMQGR